MSGREVHNVWHEVVYVPQADIELSDHNFGILVSWLSDYILAVL